MKQMKRTAVLWMVLLLVISHSANVWAYETTISSQSKDAIAEAVDYFKSIQNTDGGFPGMAGRASSLSSTSWVMMALGASGENLKSSKWSKGGNTPVDYLAACDAEVEETTEYARLALALAANGLEPIYQGENLIDSLVTNQQADGAFYQPALNETGMINAHIWSIFAIASSGRDIPNASKAKKWLLDRQNADGGFGWVEGAVSDTDDTAVAIQACVLLGENTETSIAIQNALKYIQKYQVSDGGFSAGEWMGTESNAASDAWVIQGLVAAGEDLESSKWKAGSKTVLDHLLSNQASDGSFNWKDEVSSSTTQMTAYAVMALTQKPHPVSMNYKAIPVTETQFIDVQKNYWAYDEIHSLVDSGIISGYPDKTFLPEKLVSRAEFTRFLVYGVEKQHLQYNSPLAFSDISKEHWAYDLVRIGVRQNYISGRSATTFDPNGKITGAELAVMLIRSMYVDYETKIQEGTYWYSGYVRLAESKGLLYPGFEPNAKVTRAQCAYSIKQLRNELQLD